MMRHFWVSYWSHLYNFQHFHSCNFTITIQVIHVEGPVQLLLKTASWGDGQGTNELSEVDGPISVFIKGSEGVLGKLRSISIWKELQNKIIHRTVLMQRRELSTWLQNTKVRHLWRVAGELCGKLRICNVRFPNGYTGMIIKKLFLQKLLCSTSYNTNIYNATLKLN